MRERRDGDWEHPERHLPERLAACCFLANLTASRRRRHVQMQRRKDAKEKPRLGLRCGRTRVRAISVAL